MCISALYAIVTSDEFFYKIVRGECSVLGVKVVKGVREVKVICFVFRS